METINEFLRALGRIEGQLDRMDKLDRRVGQIEIWQAWLKGGWATLAAGYACFYWAAYVK